MITSTTEVVGGGAAFITSRLNPDDEQSLIRGNGVRHNPNENRDPENRRSKLQNIGGGDTSGLGKADTFRPNGGGR